MRPLAVAMLRSCLSLLLTATPCHAEVKYALLPASAVNGITSYQGTWTPGKADIAELEASITQISKLQITGWTSALHIEHPERYFRQYVPLIRKGRRIFYVSAFCENPPPENWRKRLFVVSDGGTCFWQALYDPETGKYSHLTINARA
jgi:hypothetical protein